jgi:hypothetical protein
MTVEVVKKYGAYISKCALSGKTKKVHTAHLNCLYNALIVDNKEHARCCPHQQTSDDLFIHFGLHQLRAKYTRLQLSEFSSEVPQVEALPKTPIRLYEYI